MILGGRDFISETLTGHVDVENCGDVAVVEEIGDLHGHWWRRNGLAALKPLGCM